MKLALYRLLLLATLALFGCSSGPDYKGEAYRILQQDGYNEADQGKMVATLTDSIRLCCETYHCGPGDVGAAAFDVRNAMRPGDPTATTALAANILFQKDKSTLKDAKDALVRAFEKKEKP